MEVVSGFTVWDTAGHKCFTRIVSKEKTLFLADEKAREIRGLI